MEQVTQPLVAEIREYIALRLKNKLDEFDKKAKKALKDTVGTAMSVQTGQLSLLGQELPNENLKEKLLSDRIELQKKYEIKAWLTDAAARAWQVNMVTHAPKFTHSATKSSAVLMQKGDRNTVYPYLNSASLHDISIDVVCDTAAVLGIASLLLLNNNGRTLLDEIASGESSALAAIAENEEQLTEWLEGFGKALVAKELTSGQLSKQLYYPVTTGQYHLISPLYASSLSQAMYEKLTDSFYSDSANNARKARKGQRYSPDLTVFYPNIARQAFGGDNQQNVSRMNAKRNGKGFLLSCQPPSWQKQQTPPSQSKKSFWREYDRRAWKTAKSLQQYLEKIFTQTSTMQRREVRAEMVDDLIDILLNYAAEVQNMKDHAGWSADSKLSKAEQLWLDPYRGVDDAEFRAERATNDWQSEIASQFATWLNDKISHKSKKLYADDDTYKFWKRLLEKKLALLKEDLEVMA